MNTPQKDALRFNGTMRNQRGVLDQKHGAEFFPVAYGVQVPYVGKDDSVGVATLTSALRFPNGLAPLGNIKKSRPKTRLLGDVGDVLHQDTVADLRKKLTQTALILPDVSTRRAKTQRKQQLSEISKNIGFSEDVIALHCTHLLDYDNDGLKRTVYKRNKWRTPRVVDRHDVPYKQLNIVHPSQIIDVPAKQEVFAKIDNEMKSEMEDILYGVVRAIRPLRNCISSTVEKRRVRQKSPEWDEYVLSLLSQTTANWITTEFSSGPQNTRLTAFLKDRYKSKMEPSTGHVDNMPSIEQDPNKTEIQMTNKPSNEKFANIDYSPSFTLPTAVGDKKLITDNIFQQEILAGGFPLKGKKIPRKSVVLHTNPNLTFEKRLQANYPEDPKKWTEHRRNSKAPKHIKTSNIKVVKGPQRWDRLPSLLQDDHYTPTFKTIEDKPAATEEELQRANKTMENNNVLQIGEEWRSKWLLEKRWQNSTNEELIKGMNDIHDHVRLAAVAACSKAAEVRQRKKPENTFGLPSENKPSVASGEIHSELEPYLQQCIVKLLDDKCRHVSITAAITLSTLGLMQQKAVDILVATISNGNNIERWAAAQSLATSGHCTDNVITELVNQTTSGDLMRQERAVALLLKLSEQTSLVHAVVAEQLNSDSCHDRLIACRIFPRLKGSLNKDIAQKLSHMMWNDWQKEVRTAAAQALGRTGNGKLVHDVLLKRLYNEKERTKVDALRKLSNLGVMTAHLLPAFLTCFKNEFDTVRIEAAVAAGVIGTADDVVLNELVRLANNDQNWKVKAHCIKALGAIGKVTEDIIEMLVWNMRYSKIPAVRAEACNAVGQLGIKDTRCLSVLQDRLIVENEGIVRREARRALSTLNVEVTGDVDMVNTIRNEVKRLCNKDNIVSSIMEQDKAEDYKRDYQRLIAVDTASCRTQTPQTARSQRSNASTAGWDPILAGFRARSTLSEPTTPIMFKMERSQLPMDLNSATSEGSQDSRDDLDSNSEDAASEHDFSNHNFIAEDDIYTKDVP